MTYRLEFNEEKHEYRIDGIVKPGITTILKTLGLSKDFTGVDPFYRDRGIAVHKCIELYLQNELDESSIDPVCVPYFEGFCLWWHTQVKKSVKAIEKPLYSPRLDFCGTLDLVYGDTIIDYKCSKSPDPVSELQGAMQQVLWEENNGGGILPFRVLQLPGDGSYKLIDYKTADPHLAEHIMALYRWKMERKERKEPRGE